ncbi:MAG: 4Fe-4S dicluster domain-containing protein [Spirochaetes bacterium]|nr:4Fe-4S dicluster domain-containing protein [Spirochaetota bacterium]
MDREKCNGCGLCTTACAEGALVLDKEKKAVLVKEIFCDGMGACLDVCPVDALHIVERESEEYDAKAAFNHVKKTKGKEAAHKVHGAPFGHSAEEFIQEKGKPLACGCPGTMAQEIKKGKDPIAVKETTSGSIPSELSQWPIQLHLVSPQAPYFNESDLLIAADCTAFTLGSFHRDLLKGKKLVIACPKLDQTETYIEKISELLKNNKIFSLTVAIMTVPCCSGLNQIVEQAVQKSGKDIAIKKIVIGLDGQIR